MKHEKLVEMSIRDLEKWGFDAAKCGYDNHGDYRPLFGFADIIAAKRMAPVMLVAVNEKPMNEPPDCFDRLVDDGFLLIEHVWTKNPEIWEYELTETNLNDAVWKI